MVDEFGIIKRFFAPLAGPEGLGLEDDAAVIRPCEGKDLVISKDILVSGVHFFADDPPQLIGHKALAVNLSDLAAKGATPRFYMIGISLPQYVSKDWLSGFTKGLAEAQAAASCYVIGGDTTANRSNSLFISITVFGEVDAGRMITRSGAGVGDDIYVSGTLGDAAFGLRLLGNDFEGLLKDGVSDDLVARFPDLIKKYHYPTPRLALGRAYVGVASAAADISDGLLADIGHIVSASGTGADIYLDRLPVSPSVSEIVGQAKQFEPLIWAGGDDYELVFTAPQSMRPDVAALADTVNVLITRVGHITADKHVHMIDRDGSVMDGVETGYQHFE